MRTATALVLALTAGVALAKMPPLSDDAKAKAAESAARAAWTDKVAAYQLCQAQDRVAARYRTAMSSATPALALAPTQTAPCADPGPFTPPMAAKPLEAAGAHSPAETAKGPPNTTATAAELAGGAKKN